MVRFEDHDGGEQQDSLAPVIPLFGDQAREQRRVRPGSSPSGEVASSSCSTERREETG